MAGHAFAKRKWTDAELYELYVKECKNIGQKPMTFEEFCKNIEGQER